MKKKFLFLISLGFFWVIQSNTLLASHIMGSDITYRCLGGLQYEFTLSFYFDCQSTFTMPTTFTINGTSSCVATSNITVTQTSNTEVTQVCGAQLGSTTCSGGTIPGIREYIYVGTTTLSQNCADWVFSFDHNARNNAITTITNAGFVDLYTETTLNSVTAPCNSSPQFINDPAPYLCLNTAHTYNSGATDADGDSLVYSLVDSRSNPNITVPYINPFNGLNPIASTPAVSIDSNTGTVEMTPTQLQVGVMAIKVDEYRNGVLIGSVIRDMQIQVQNCGVNTAPTFSAISNLSGGFQPSNFRIEICPGQNITFNISGSDPDIGNALTITDNNGIPAATFNTTGTNPINGSFSWTPTIADLGFHSLVLTLEDDGCPFKGRQSLGLEVWVLDGAYAGADVDLCINNLQGTTLSAVGGSIFGWSVISGDVNSMSCGNCATQVVTPTVTTVYEILTNFTCGNRDSVTVSVNPVTTLTSSNDTAVCGLNNNLQLLTTPADPGVYSYNWTPNTNLNNNAVNNPVASPGATTRYYVTVTDQNNCDVIDSVDITVNGTFLDGTPVQTEAVYCEDGTPVRLYSNPFNGDCDLHQLSSITFAPQAAPANTVTLADDDVTTVNMGMTFEYYCNSFTTITISSNGWVSFNPYAAGQSTSLNATIPNGADPNNLIALAWDDLDPGSGGTISYGLTGTAPNRTFVVDYSNVPHFGSTSTISSQLILYEGTNIIEIHSSDIQDDGGTLTQGFEGPNGQGAAVTGRNNQVWSATNDAVRYDPIGILPYTVSWQSPLGTVIGTSDSIDVSPAANTAYYAILTDVNSGCTDTLDPITNPSLNVDAATVDAGNNQVVNFGTPAQLTGTYTGPLPQPNCLDYISSAVAYTPYTLAAPTTINLDLGTTPFSAAIPLGFDFDYYCNTQSDVYFAAAGYMTFDNAGSVTTPTTLPDATAPNNVIAYSWASLDVMTVSYETQGTAPNRRFVAEVSAIHWFSNFTAPPGDPVDVQIVLYESGEIDMFIDRIAASWFSNMTQGIEGPAGANGLPITGRNNAVAPTGFTAATEGIRFELRPAVVNYSWTPAATLNDPLIFNPEATPPVDTWYYLTVDNGTCTLLDSVLISILPLPIELLGFTGEKVGQTSLLEWQTTLEINADHFAIEHSQNGIDFTEVGQVAAVGESGELQEYEFTHVEPALGKNYYRLKMIDQDGQFEYANTVELYFDEIGQQALVNVHPNPSTGVFYFDFAIQNESQVSLEVINFAGQVVQTRVEQFTAGRQHLALDLSEFAAGVYLYRLKTATWTSAGKLTIKK